MNFIQAILLQHVILKINWTVKGSDSYGQLEISSQVNNGSGTVNFGSDSIDEETVEAKGTPF